MAKPTLVYYIVPSDYDDMEHPNAFPIQKPQEEIKLKDIRAKFPLPGKYHFRFKLRYDNSFVWIDVTNDDSSVPIFQQRIVAKVLRLSWHEKRGPIVGKPDSGKLGDATNDIQTIEANFPVSHSGPITPNTGEEMIKQTAVSASNLLDLGDVQLPNVTAADTSLLF
eukprot:Platyproteum_vivax@DN2580_c0_g1_i1.p1